VAVESNDLEIAVLAGFGVLSIDLVADFDRFDGRQAGFDMDQRPGGEGVGQRR
jgi:hypothetical protein